MIVRRGWLIKGAAAHFCRACSLPCVCVPCMIRLPRTNNLRPASSLSPLQPHGLAPQLHHGALPPSPMLFCAVAICGELLHALPMLLALRCGCSGHCGTARGWLACAAPSRPCCTPIMHHAAAAAVSRPTASQATSFSNIISVLWIKCFFLPPLASFPELQTHHREGGHR